MLNLFFIPVLYLAVKRITERLPKSKPPVNGVREQVHQEV